MPRYALDCEFDGRAFHGTQVQAAERTLQGLLSDVARDLAGTAVVPRPASRLDAEVSAEHLPCDLLLAQSWRPRELANAFNARLPRDVVVQRAAVVDDGWHAQRDAVSKCYRYQLIHRPTRPVLETRSTWVRRLDHRERLDTMAALLIGSLDLSGFACLRHDDTDGDDPVRAVSDAHWDSAPGDGGCLLTFRITGAGFLYKQVRGLVGAMLAVAQGRRSMEQFRQVVRDGRQAERLGNIAPAHGLVLEAVHYQPEPAWEAP